MTDGGPELGKAEIKFTFSSTAVTRGSNIAQSMSQACSNGSQIHKLPYTRLKLYHLATCRRLVGARCYN